jgi:quinol-cytochrome oxidoreductase complex cytochrome b subunit
MTAESDRRVPPNPGPDGASAAAAIAPAPAHSGDGAGPLDRGGFWDNARHLPENLRDSVVRSGPAVTDRARAQKVFSNFFLHVHSTRVHLNSLRFSATMAMGVSVVACFGIATVTGVLLMIYYTPSTELAYQSIKDIHFTVPTGRFIRNLHRWSAQLMVATVMLHAMRVFYTASYKKPREFNWVIGMMLLVVTLGLSFTGYLLPWDQLAYWAATIGANIAASPRELTDALGITAWFDPGGMQKVLLLGAEEVGQPALTRFYFLHVMLLPIAVLVLLGLHFWRIRKDGGLARPTDEELVARGLLPDQPPVPALATPTGGPSRGGPAFERGGRKTYGLMAVVRGRTATVAKGPDYTVPAYPWALRAELAVGMAVVALCLALAYFLDAPLKEVANPLIPENPAKAPWYFLGLQELVSYSGFMGGVALPGLVVLGLLLIPFLDREPETGGVWFGGERGRRVFVGSAVFAATFVIALEAFAIRFGWLRTWFPEINQLWIILINPGTVIAAAFVAWSQIILRRSRSTRLAAIALVTTIMVAFLILTVIGTQFRGPNWDFYWSKSQWPVH